MFTSVFYFLIIFFLTSAKDLENDLLKFFNKINSQTAYPWAETFLTTQAPDPNEDQGDPILFVNKEKSKAYAAQLNGFTDAIQNYGKAYSEYLAHKNDYQQQLIEEKMKAMDNIRREQYVEYVKNLRVSYDLENKLQDEKGIDNTVGGQVLTEPIDAYKKDPEAPITGSQKPINSHDELDLILLKRFGINVNDPSDEDLRILKAIRSVMREERQLAIDEGTRVVLERIPMDIGRQNSGDSSKAKECAFCKPINPEALIGNWTMMFGNPNEIKTTVKSLFSLQGVNKNLDLKCIGMKINVGTEIIFKSKDHEILVSFFKPIQFKDHFSLLGDLIQERNAELKQLKQFTFTSKEYQTKFCLLFMQENHEFFISSTSNGGNKCKALQIWTKQPATFLVNHFKQVDRMMKRLISVGVLPVGPLPSPASCFASR